MSDGAELSWLVEALARHYRIDGPMRAPTPDTVRVLAREIALDRPVEIIALKRGSTTRERTESFQAWARLLSRVNHPNVVGVYHAGVERGVPFFAIEHFEGETLAAAITRGALGAVQVARLGRDLLLGLEVSHALGVAYPELGPETIRYTPSRSVLTALGSTIGDRATASDDLRAVAATLYQAATGRQWSANESDGAALWETVPRRLRPVLRRALSRAPADAWADAAAFRRALEPLARPGRGGGVLAAAALLLLGLALGGWALRRPVGQWLCHPPGPVPRQLALLPLEGTGGEGADSLGLAVANIVQYTLDNLPGLEPTPWSQIIRYWEKRHHVVDGAEAPRALKARWAAHGLLNRNGDRLSVRLTLYDESGQPRPLPEMYGSSDSLARLADLVGVRLLHEVAPELEARYIPLADLSDVPLGALKPFFQGEAAFARDDLERAVQSYNVAIAQDSGFALARWRRANVRRWQRVEPGFDPWQRVEPGFDPWQRVDSTLDLRTFSDRYGERLGRTDRALVAALLESDIERRLTLLEAVVRQAPADAYARFIYGEELFHRGPLVGRDLDSAGRVMSGVIERDSSFAEAYNHLFAIHLRAGRRPQADSMLRLRRCVALHAAPGDLDKVEFLQLAYQERFTPWRGALSRWWLDHFATSSKRAEVAKVARLGVPWFDLPATQLSLSRILLAHARNDTARASARTGAALALLTLGRAEAGLAQLDTAVALRSSGEARVQQAEWRAVLPFLGLPSPSATDPAWEARLSTFASDSVLRVRVLWALALRRLGTGDTAAFERTRSQLDSLAPGARLGRLLDAVHESASGRPAVALAITDSIRPWLDVDHPPDPFAGAVLHLLRGEWLASMGELRHADQEWAWYEGSDFEGWPVGVPQAGEINGTFGVYARWRRGRARLAQAASAADTASGCALLARSAELWRQADSSMARLVDSVTSRMQGCET
jgi:hypothetical protein